MIDTHCHLYFPEFDQDRNEVIKRARKRACLFVQVGASLEGSRKAVDLANRHGDMIASVGMHPHEAHKYAQVQRLKFKVQNENLDIDIAELRKW